MKFEKKKSLLKWQICALDLQTASPVCTVYVCVCVCVYVGFNVCVHQMCVSTCVGMQERERDFNSATPLSPVTKPQKNK